MKFLTFSSPFSPFTIVWKGNEPDLKIKRVFLSDQRKKSEEKAQESLKLIKKGSSSSITAVAENIRLFLRGEEVEFEMKNLDFTICSRVQEEVLQAENQIPRGWVSTYKRIADHIGIKNGARIVGNSLAKNPFPIIIPCHRAIKTNGKLGGFQGGIKMKHTLLELEGIKISNKGEVITDRIYY